MKKILLYILSILYKTGVDIRNKLYDWNILTSTEFRIPIISVGNITVGGTGKTPHTEYLINLLQEEFSVATLSRGYKRQTKGFKLVETGSTVQEVGDEPLQLKKKFSNATVTVCENRVKGVETILGLKEQSSPDVIILDDAFQHRKITPGLNILLMDYNRPVKDDYMLPLGNLRDTKSQIKRANIVIVSKCPKNITAIQQRIIKKDLHILPYQDLYFTTIKYGNLLPISTAKPIDHKKLKSKQLSIIMVTAIASSKPLEKFLRKYAAKFSLIDFPDHHYFNEEDIIKISEEFESFSDSKDKIIVTTEKDSIRLQENPFISEKLKSSIYFMPIEIQFLNNGEKEFNKKIKKYVGNNKSNREVYKK